MMRSVMGRPGLRLRAGLAQVQARGLAIPGVRPADGEGQDWIVFPRERQGRDYSLNHSLNRQSIVPIGDAFLNPSVSMLSSKLGIKAGAGGGNSLKVAGPDPAAPVHPLLEAGTAELSFDAYDDIAEAAQGHLSSGVDIYVADGTAGSYRGARVGVRIITDDPAVCMAARSLLVPSPVVKYENADTPLSPIVAYVTSAGLKASVIQYSENESGALCGASIVLSGAAAASQGTLAAAIEKVARSVLAESELVTILPATTLRKGSKTALYFGAGPDMVAQAQELGALYAAHNCIWSGAGLSAFWGGAITSSAPKVPSPTVGKLSITPVPADNLVQSPSLVFFPGSKGKLSPDDAAQELEKAGVPADARDKFLALLKSSNASLMRASSIKEAVDQL